MQQLVDVICHFAPVYAIGIQRHECHRYTNSKSMKQHAPHENKYKLPIPMVGSNKNYSS
ncbi:hypothetical protein SAMN05216323_102114 [Williamwhitmania taraxaci]|uniref:Uncharacterized protein n=1 Tax=Williamwhitmania taraxaci TaxID=1640674 RepID=A0A1G6JPZ5_9BACT|nr:hypothetical protein SAMN05216323_102114 [Williamwhitmania taraxaci]